MAHHNYASPLRYPGGKGTLANFVKLVIAENNLLDGDYVEVYAGGAGIVWSLLFEEYVRCVHINDLSVPIMAFWEFILDKTDEFCQLVWDTPITMDEWNRQKTIQCKVQDHSRLELGFSTFFLNRTNRSGILMGGVVGGKTQAGKWKMDARFNKKDLVARIQRISRYKSRIKHYNLDAAQFIRTILPNLPQKTLVYLDPPYVCKGHELYENHYQQEDHRGIANLVSQEIHQPWLVSYDATPLVMELYSRQLHFNYFVQYSAQDRYAGAEVIFHSDRLQIPQVVNPTKVKLPTLMKPLLSITY